jgi:NADH-quinone oxidoreductase subunit J
MGFFEFVIIVWFLLLLLLLTFGIILSKNPIYTILYFICFLIILGLFFILFLNLEFLGLILIIVYAGAIAVLFLFVVMMFNIRVIELINEKIGIFFLLIYFILMLLYILIVLFFNDVYKTSLIFLNLNYYNYAYMDTLNLFVFFPLYFNFYNILENLCYLFYNYYINFIFGIALLLLVAMVGSIILTYNKIILNKQQNLFYQIEKIIILRIKKR